MRPALWAAVSLLTVILIGAATRRTLALWSPAAGLDAGFTEHRILTLAHILPGLAFVVLGPFQFAAGLRKRRPILHRWMGRIYLSAAVVTGATALVMSPQMAVGGAVEIAATFTFGGLFLLALGKGFAAIRARRVEEHRRWMIRAYAIGLGAGTVRPIMGVFFATSRLTHLTPHEFFGIAFWAGFTLSLATAETWLRFKPRRTAESLPVRGPDRGWTVEFPP